MRTKLTLTHSLSLLNHIRRPIFFGSPTPDLPTSPLHPTHVRRRQCLLLLFRSPLQPSGPDPRRRPNPGPRARPLLHHATRTRRRRGGRPQFRRRTLLPPHRPRPEPAPPRQAPCRRLSLLRRRTRHSAATGGRHSRAGTRRRPPPVLRPSRRRQRRSLQLVQIDKIKIDSGYFTHAQISASNSRTRAPPLRRRPPPHGPPLGVPPQIHLAQVRRRPSPLARQRPRPIPCAGLGRPLAASRRPSMARPQVRRSGRAPPQPLPAPSR